MDAAQITVVLLAVSIGFFAKGVTGIGGPLLAIPALAAFQGIEYAVAVIAIPTLVANTWLVWRHRSAAGNVWRYLIPLLGAGIVGAVVGAWVLVTVNEKILTVILALFVIAYIVLYLANPQLRLGERLASRLSIPVGLVGGGLQGATGISGPVLATFMHSLRLTREEFIFAVTLPFQVLGMVQVISMTALGVYNTERLTAGLMAIIPVAVILPIAMRIGARLSHRTFDVAVLVVLAVTAFRLLWSVF